MITISKELADKIIETLNEGQVWEYECWTCAFCGNTSEPHHGELKHSPDCDGQLIIKELERLLNERR